MHQNFHDQNIYHVPLLIVLTKVLVTVNRALLWKLLDKLECPDHFVSMIKSFHDGIETWVNVSRIIAEPIPVENCIKLDEILARTRLSFPLMMF